MSISQAATSSQSSSSHSNHQTPQPLSRLARLGAGLGLGLKSQSNLHTNAGNVASTSSQPVYNDANDSDWYIPYNGPYELPPKDAVLGVSTEGELVAGKGKGKRREVRDSWADFITNLQQTDPFARDNNLSQSQISGLAGASASAGAGGNGNGRTRSQRSGSLHQEDERGRTRSRAFSGSTGSKYPTTDSSVMGPLSPISPRPRGHTFGHGSSYASPRAPVPSFVGDVGIGETPVPLQRVNSQAQSHGHNGHGHGILHSFAHGHGHDRGHERSPHAHFAFDHTADLQTHQFHSTQSVSQNPRASHSSFWTFGAGGSRKSAPSLYSGGSVSVKDKDREGDKESARPSAETFFTSGGRPSTSTHQTFGTASRDGGQKSAQGQNTVPMGRDRSATFGERNAPVGLGGSYAVRPRANTALPSTVNLPNVFSPPPTQVSQPNANAKGKQRADTDRDQDRDRERDYPATSAAGGSPPSDQSHSTFSFHNHPYAVNFPSSGHREHSQIIQPSPSTKKPMISLVVPFLSPSKSNLPHHLRSSSNKMLKASVSTPNLRGAANASSNANRTAGGRGVGGLGHGAGLGLSAGLEGPRAPGSGCSSPSASGSGRWLSAETWCDALIFPRPRFRMRGAAHTISPPGSPTKNYVDMGSGTGTGTGSATASGQDILTPPNTAAWRKKSIKKSLGQAGGGGQGQEQQERKWPLLAPPSSSEPPLLISAARDLSGANEFGGEPEKRQQKEESPSKGQSNGSSGVKGELRPPRPKSFALDDLALPSPVPSLARVLRENEAFDKERIQWKQTAAKSFQNKRARSLSRSRLKNMTHGRKNSYQDTETVTSFGIIASTAFHGHQLAKPSISINNSSTGSRSMGTNSTGINTTSTHSRKSSNASHAAKGHGRKESWSKVAIKSAKSTANATGLCAFNIDVSPVDEKALNLERALDDEGRTKYVSLDLQRAEEKREAGEGGVVLIASHANAKQANQLAVPQPRPAVVFSPSPVPSNSSDASQSTSSQTGVGIALSTPTVLVPDQEQFLFPDHPYASIVAANRESVPRASDYAGPHPTSTAKMAEFTVDDSTLNNVSARHRLPPAVNRMYAQVERHPYATAQASSSSSSRSRPTLQVPTTRPEVSPSKRMFAEVNQHLREVLPDEIQYSPYSMNPPSRASKRDSDALGVEEALSVAFSRGSMDDVDMDEMDMEGEEPLEEQVLVVDEEDLTGTSAADAQILTAQSATRSAPMYRLMPQIDEDSVRDSWRDSRDGGESTGIPLSNQHTPAASGFSMKESSPSINSSPMTSPRVIRRYDENEDFSDLFYRPGQSAGNSVRAPSMEISRGLVSREPSGSVEKAPYPISRTESVSALTGLTRKLSEEYSTQLEDERRTFGGRDSPIHQLEQGHSLEHHDEAEMPTLLSHGSPPGANVPLRVPTTRPQSIDPSILVPEDVRSSRASSILDPQGTEEGTDVTYRLGQVPALATPNPTSALGAHRSSSHGSYFGDVMREEDNEDNRPDSTQDATYLSPLRPSLAPPPTSATDTTRASYVTSTSSASRISQLSDFPVPPNQGSMTPGAIIQSYFRSLPDEPSREGGHSVPLQQHEIGARQSRRTTFGGEEEVPSFDVSDA